MILNLNTINHSINIKLGKQLGNIEKSLPLMQRKASKPSKSNKILTTVFQSIEWFECKLKQNRIPRASGPCVDHFSFLLKLIYCLAAWTHWEGSKLLEFKECYDGELKNRLFKIASFKVQKFTEIYDVSLKFTIKRLTAPIKFVQLKQASRWYKGLCVYLHNFTSLFVEQARTKVSPEQRA